jgi:hypothetical protein
MLSIVETGFRGGAIALHLLFAVLILREARHAPALLAQPMAREPAPALVHSHWSGRLVTAITSSSS